MRGRHSSFEGDPKGGGARGAGHAGEVRSRRDAKRRARARARAQLNNGLPCPPSLHFLALLASLFPSSSLLSPSPRRYYSSLILILALFYPLRRGFRLPTYLLPACLTTITVYLLSLVSPKPYVPYRTSKRRDASKSQSVSERQKSGAASSVLVFSGLTCARYVHVSARGRFLSVLFSLARHPSSPSFFLPLPLPLPFPVPTRPSYPRLVLPSTVEAAARLLLACSHVGY